MCKLLVNFPRVFHSVIVKRVKANGAVANMLCSGSDLNTVNIAITNVSHIGITK